MREEELEMEKESEDKKLRKGFREEGGKEREIGGGGIRCFLASAEIQYSDSERKNLRVSSISLPLSS